jgi:hypothetical protein
MRATAGAELEETTGRYPDVAMFGPNSIHHRLAHLLLPLGSVRNDPAWLIKQWDGHRFPARQNMGQDGGNNRYPALTGSVS